MALPPKQHRMMKDEIGQKNPRSPRTRMKVELFEAKKGWYVQCLQLWSDDSSFFWLFVTLTLFLAKGVITTLECDGDWESAIIVLLSALIPCCLWAVFFVFMSKRGHGDQFREHLSFGVLAQTFWLGAIVAPIAVYTVRAFAAGIVTALLGYSAMAFSAEPQGEPDSTVNIETVLATAWLAFILAGFSEETAKFFVASRWVRAKDDFGSKADLEEDMGGCSYAIGWSKRTRSPRKVVLLAMVVGLGFSWIENVQYGVRTYEQMVNTQLLMEATKADITVLCSDPLHPKIVVLSGVLEKPNVQQEQQQSNSLQAHLNRDGDNSVLIPARITYTDHSSSSSSQSGGNPQAALAKQEQEQQKTSNNKLAFFMSTDSGWIPFLGKMKDRIKRGDNNSRQLRPVNDDSAIIWEFKSQIFQGIYEGFVQTNHAVKKATDGMHSYITKGLLEPSSANDMLELSPSTKSDQIINLEEPTSSSVVNMGVGDVGGENNNNKVSQQQQQQQQQQKSNDSNKSKQGNALSKQTLSGVCSGGKLGSIGDDPKQRETIVVRALTRYGFANPDGNDTQVAITAWNDTAINCTVQSMEGRPLYDEERGATAVMVTVTRGFMPMHAIWVGLSGMRYVRAHWIIQATNGFFIDPIKCISHSWLYHGVFDFVLMSADQLRVALKPSVSNPYVSWFIVMAIGTFVILTSWIHLVREGSQLEHDLNRNGYPGSQDIANVALCSGQRRRAYCCLCESCACCCNFADDDDEEDALAEADERTEPLLDNDRGDNAKKRYGSNNEQSSV